MESNKSVLNDLTIAIPTYNRQRLLEQLIHTVTSKEVNIVICDNGCFLDQNFVKDNPHVSVQRVDPVVGMFQNWNNSIRLVKSKWFMLPSDDDVFYPDSFDNINRALFENDDSDIIIFGHNVIDGNDNVMSSWAPKENKTYPIGNGLEQFIWGVDARLPSIIFKTELLKKVGLIDESFECTAADSLFIQRYLAFGKATFVTQILSGYRTWPENYTNILNGTPKWLKDIDKWQDNLTSLMQEANISTSYNYNVSQIKDEVYANNLIQSIKVQIKNKGKIGALNFLLTNRYPTRARLITHLRIIKMLVLNR